MYTSGNFVIYFSFGSHPQVRYVPTFMEERDQKFTKILVPMRGWGKKNTFKGTEGLRVKIILKADMMRKGFKPKLNKIW